MTGGDGGMTTVRVSVWVPCTVEAVLDTTPRLGDQPTDALVDGRYLRSFKLVDYAEYGDAWQAVEEALEAK